MASQDNVHVNCMLLADGAPSVKQDFIVWLAARCLDAQVQCFFSFHSL